MLSLRHYMILYFMNSEGCRENCILIQCLKYKKIIPNEIWFVSQNRKKCTSSWSTVMRALWRRYQNWAFRSTSLGCTQSRSPLLSTCYMNTVLFIETLKVMLTRKVMLLFQCGRWEQGEGWGHVFAYLVCIIYATITCIKPSIKFSVYKPLDSFILFLLRVDCKKHSQLSFQTHKFCPWFI